MGSAVQSANSGGNAAADQTGAEEVVIERRRARARASKILRIISSSQAQQTAEDPVSEAWQLSRLLEKPAMLPPLMM